MMIKVAQLRAARALLGWSQDQLVKASSVSISTIKRMEGSQDPMRGTAENVWKIQSALETAGIVFIDDNGGGPGVRLKEPLKK